MSISGYTEEAFKFGAFNMPSPFRQDYKQGKDGLWYFKGGDGGVKKEEPYKSRAHWPRRQPARRRPGWCGREKRPSERRARRPRRIFRPFPGI